MEVRLVRVVTLSSRVEPATPPPRKPNHKLAISLGYLDIGTYTEILITRVSGRVPGSHASPAQSSLFQFNPRGREIKKSDSWPSAPTKTLMTVPYRSFAATGRGLDAGREVLIDRFRDLRKFSTLVSKH